MNPSQDPFNQSPIATPDGRSAPVRTAPIIVDHSNWKSAPQIVRSVQLLNLLGAVIFALALICFIVMLASGGNKPEDVVTLSGYAVFALVFLGINGWMLHAFRHGITAAWTLQIILSCLGLLSFPIGTLINAYILSQWFSPEVKAWFRRS